MIASPFLQKLISTISIYRFLLKNIVISLILIKITNMHVYILIRANNYLDFNIWLTV
jgi:hypothetical protein